MTLTKYKFLDRQTDSISAVCFRHVFIIDIKKSSHLQGRNGSNPLCFVGGFLRSFIRVHISEKIERRYVDAVRKTIFT